jgi:uncharacterized lipoprotein YddW (UPF0748 family)
LNATTGNTRVGLRGVCGVGALLLAVAVVTANIQLRETHGVKAFSGATGEHVCKADPLFPKRQFRAMWLATVSNMNWPSSSGLPVEEIKAQYIDWIDLAQRSGMNAIIVQVRDGSGVLWPSEIEPWSQYLTGERGQDPGWDPLAFIISEAHRRDLEFHAWYYPYIASMAAPDGAGTQVNKLASGHPLREHPDWAVSYPSGSGGKLYYDPGIPQARQLVENLILESVSRYDIDAVHFDDFFYPYPKSGEDFPDNDSYSLYGDGFSDKASWRRHNVDLLIGELHDRIRAAKPWVRFGVSPYGVWRNASADPAGSDSSGTQSYVANYADTRSWILHGWIDYIVPQLYWNIGNQQTDYAKLVRWWAQVVSGTKVHLYIGQAAYKPGAKGGWSDPGELSSHLRLNRQYPQVRGDVFFSARDIRADRLGAISLVINEQYRTPALVPDWGPDEGKPVSQVEVQDAVRTGPGGAIEIRWRLADSRGPSGEDEIRSYAVYRTDGGASAARCGFVDATQLLTTTRDGSYLDQTAQSGRRYTYYVTALNRRMKESQPSLPQTVA